MKLRLSVTTAESPVLLFLCQGWKQGSADANHDNDRHLDLVWHGTPWSSQGIPLSNISITTSDKVTRGDTSNLRQRSGQKWSHLDSNDQLVERGCPFHLPCQSSIQINHHIIRNEEASCEERHSEQCECPVSAIMSAATNPCRTRLSVKWHSVHSEK